MNSLENMDDLCYNKNFLKEVIVKVDLVSPIESLVKDIPKSIRNIALEYFPIPEPKLAFLQNVQLGPKSIETTKTEFTEWNFYGGNREKRLTITPQFFFISYTQYNKFESLQEEFINFLNQFNREFEYAQANRLGLRYINNINIKKEDPLNWDDYIDNKLLGLFSLNIENAKPSRIFHNIVYSFQNFNLRFQFGMHNPDFPAPIKQNIFILDFDAYLQGLIDPHEIPQNLETYHNEIQKLFEQSITSKLRDLMNE